MTWYEQIVDAGIRRVIVVGTARQMDGPEYRRPLAASGVLVLVPAREQRERISRIAERGPAGDDVSWLAEVLSHGLEHGAQAILACDDALAALVGAMDLAVPVIRPLAR